MIGRGLHLGLGATVVLVAGGGIAAPAFAQQGQLSVDASVSGGVASNPFLESNESGATGSATIQVSPTYLLSTANTRFSLRGDASLTEYLKRYRSTDSYSLNGSGVHQISERTTLTARLGYNNSVVGAFTDTGIIVPGITPTFPTTAITDQVDATSPIVTPADIGIISNIANDPSLGGIGRRRQSYTIGTGVSTGIGPRDRVGLDLSIVASRSKGFNLNDFNYVTQQLNYSRAIRDGLDLTAGLVIGHVDYLRQRVNDANTYQPTVGVNYVISQGMSLNLSVGVSIVHSKLPTPGATVHSTSPSVQGSLCQQDGRTNACFSLSRSAQPSSFSGVRVQTAGSASGGFRLSQRASLSISTSYSRSGGPLGTLVANGPIISDRTEYLTSRANLDYSLSRRISAFVSTGAARVFADQQSFRKPSYDMRAGVRIRFGASS